MKALQSDITNILLDKILHDDDYGVHEDFEDEFDDEDDIEDYFTRTIMKVEL